MKASMANPSIFITFCDKTTKTPFAYIDAVANRRSYDQANARKAFAQDLERLAIPIVKNATGYDLSLADCHFTLSVARAGKGKVFVALPRLLPDDMLADSPYVKETANIIRLAKPGLTEADVLTESLRLNKPLLEQALREQTTVEVVFRRLFKSALREEVVP